MYKQNEHKPSYQPIHLNYVLLRMSLRKHITTVVCCLLLLTTTKLEAQDRISILVKASGGLSYTGGNAYLALGGAYRKHLLYIGPKAVLTKGYPGGRMLWGTNAGYSFSVVESYRWNAFLNADYQLTRFRNPGILKYNSIQEITVGAGINYFPAPQRFSIGLLFGSGIRSEKGYNRYEPDASANTGLMHQVRLSLTYKISQ